MILGCDLELVHLHIEIEVMRKGKHILEKSSLLLFYHVYPNRVGGRIQGTFFEDSIRILSAFCGHPFFSLTFNIAWCIDCMEIEQELVQSLITRGEYMGSLCLCLFILSLRVFSNKQGSFTKWEKKYHPRKVQK